MFESIKEKEEIIDILVFIASAEAGAIFTVISSKKIIKALAKMNDIW